VQAVNEPTASTTIVLADDHTIVRNALRALLEAGEGVEVVAEAADIEETVRKVRAYKPNVLVLDLSMPGGSSLGSIPEMRSASPDTAIVVLTMEDEPRFVREALRAGAAGFVLKEAADTELLQAIDAARKGLRYINPQLGALIAAQPQAPAEHPDGLSDREVEVLRCSASSPSALMAASVAAVSFLSIRSVDSRASRAAYSAAERAE
jgi:two-component system, NarL family, response regulator NreC